VWASADGNSTSPHSEVNSWAGKYSDNSLPLLLPALASHWHAFYNIIATHRQHSAWKVSSASSSTTGTCGVCVSSA